MSCKKPRPTKRIVNPGTGPLAWCGFCKSWQPAAQVPWGQELRNKRTDKIIATYAAKPH